MYYVYVLYSKKDNNLYTGYTSNLRLRYTQHSQGKVKATKARLPIVLIYYEAYLDKKDATKRGYFLKRGRGRELLRKLLAGSLEKVIGVQQ